MKLEEMRSVFAAILRQTHQGPSAGVTLGVGRARAGFFAFACCAATGAKVSAESDDSSGFDVQLFCAEAIRQFQDGGLQPYDEGRSGVRVSQVPRPSNLASFRERLE